ncbi:MAG: hypothetical protein RL685_4947 [Pseudomonadota bacterium]|jgi:hypothetical protein
MTQRARSWLFGVALLAAGVGLGSVAPRWFAQVEDVRRRPDVITQVRELSRLEGVSYHVERVVDLKDEQRQMFGLVAADSILLVASGDVVAGVDLGKLAPGDVAVSPDGRSVTIHLPPAEVFSSRLDNAHTYVHSRKTDLLAQRQESLETRARQAAEQTLRLAAEDAGIVKRAEDSVARTVRSLVRALGFETVIVDVREPA